MRWILAKGAAGASGGPPALLGLLLLCEAGLPVPIPGDLLMILLGERVAAGAVPLAAVVVGLQVIAIAGTAALFWAARGPGKAAIARLGPRIGLTAERIERAEGLVGRRGTVALTLGRSTPGLRTVTVVAAAGSGIRSGRAIVALLIGSTLFVQGHFFLGLALGEAARATFQAAGTVSVILLGALAVAGLIFWLVRRRGRQGLQGWSEACCPACLALSVVSGSGSPARD